MNISNFKIFNLIIVVGFLLPFIGLSQVKFGDYKPLYKDNNITIQVAFKNYECNLNKSNQIKYRYKGTASFNKEYVAWTFDYNDCSGNLRYKTFSLDISLENINNIQKDDWSEISNSDETFEGKDIVHNYYSVYLSKTIKSNSGLKPITKSTKPNRIIANGIFIYGKGVKLEVEGGSLSPGSKWVWYENSCGGTFKGYGSSIDVITKKDTKYFVRAEGKDVTPCAELIATIKLNGPTSIIAPSSVSFGEKITLKVDNNALCDGCYWEWYEGNINNTPIGRGNEITKNQFKTTTYFVRAIGLGSKSNYTKTTVSVDRQLSSNSKVELNNNNIEFTYYITNCQPKHLYNIKLEGINEKNSEKVKIASLKGDIYNVSGCNQKKIIWNHTKDGYKDNEKLFFTISGQRTFRIYKHVLKSVIWPGWGDMGDNTNETNTKILGLGVFSYCLIGNAILFNKLSKDSYNKYLVAKYNNDLQKYYNNTNSFKNVSLLSALASSLIITIDLARIVKRFERAKRDPSNPSDSFESINIDY
jgi:hypothetical protein